jgi:hypothetical protein
MMRPSSEFPQSCFSLVGYQVTISCSLNFTISLRRSRWINPQEDPNLASMSEMPGIPFNEFASARELPKPIRLRGHAS